MERLNIDLGKNSYPIHIGTDLLQDIESYTEEADKWFIITDENVSRLFNTEIKHLLNKKNTYQYTISPGESSKSFSTVENILNSMIAYGLTRKSMVIAIGGGVVGDIAGFCASIYMRGISFIQVPTTLLSQVDSSVGGKTGVNMIVGKNMVGSFYQPKAVVIDIDTLKTLPRRELISGVGEVIKYGIIYDYQFFKYISDKFLNIMNLEEEVMKKVIKTSCEIKADIISKDEKEENIRKILNYGHTIGHALEAATNYKTYTHGEAVLIGMYYEGLMAKGLGYIDELYFSQIEKIIKKTGISFEIDNVPLKVLIDKMENDKKNRNGKISFILPNGQGKVIEVLLNKEEIVW